MRCRTGAKGHFVNEFRVTKYDPTHRNARGHYQREEWIMVSQIGESFDGFVLTDAEYQRVEDCYARVAVAFIQEAGVQSLAVVGLESRTALSFGEGSLLSLAEIGPFVRRMLREEFWCRLECAEAFIHIGWDYYMYIGVTHTCPGAKTLAQQLGLFVEPFSSPYSERVE